MSESVFMDEQNGLLGIFEPYEPKCDKIDSIKNREEEEVTVRHLISLSVTSTRPTGVFPKFLPWQGSRGLSRGRYLVLPKANPEATDRSCD